VLVLALVLALALALVLALLHSYTSSNYVPLVYISHKAFSSIKLIYT
jgi:hypothetical protein